MLSIEKNAIEIGLEKPFKVLHVTDSHVPLCDGRDSEFKQAIALRKAPKLDEYLANLNEQAAYAEQDQSLAKGRGQRLNSLKDLPGFRPAVKQIAQHDQSICFFVRLELAQQGLQHIVLAVHIADDDRFHDASISERIIRPRSI